PTLYEREPCLALAVLQLPGRDAAVAEVHRHRAAGLKSDDSGRVPDLVAQRFLEPAHRKASADPRLDPDRKAGPRTDLIGVDERVVETLARRVDLQLGPEIGPREVAAVPDAPSFQEVNEVAERERPERLDHTQSAGFGECLLEIVVRLRDTDHARI